MNQTNHHKLTDLLNFSFWQKTPQILQTEMAECGLASLAMVCGHYGMNVDLFYLRQQYGISSGGTTLQELTRIASSLHFHSRALSLDMDELTELKLPCILHWDMNHFVVLVKADKNRFVIHDPASGKKVLSYHQVSQHFTGVALELWPSPEFKPVEHRTKLNLWEMILKVKGFKSTLIKIFCLSMLIEFIGLLTPVGTQLVMDHVLPADDRELLTLICIGLLFFILFRTFSGMLRSWMSLRMEILINLQWKNGLFTYLMKLPLAYFEKRKLGDIQSRFNSIDTVLSTLTKNIVLSIIDVIMLIGVFLMMLFYGNWLVWVVLLFTIIYLSLRMFTYQYYRQVSEELIVKNARMNSHFMESLYGIGTIKALGLASQRNQRWFNMNVETSNATINQRKLELFFEGTNSLVTTLDQIVILWLGASMIIDEQITLGMFVAFNAYRGQFSERSASLINSILQLRILSLHNDRIADIALTDAEEDKPPVQLLESNQPVGLQLKNITFQYDPLSPPLFANLNLSIQAGENVAIVGPSGIGKSTLMKVMAGLLQPSEGRILFNDIDIYHAGLNNYRQHIACVLQEDKLFAGSIAENIASFDPKYDKEQVITCARQAALHDEIMRLPMGYETLLSELGNSLSGGQKQRLLIARALYRQPAILFMDEATSHLDLYNEQQINNAIKSLNITRIIIAHRPSTIESADRIVNLIELLAPSQGRYNL